ncbi:MAG: GNAT family N-acetyltransferase [Ardenticatenales bacterium]|nr:GNAT family N-acetyltransferase [Ardenticatenales bacterium]
MPTTLPLTKLDRFWASELGCEPADLRATRARLVPCGQRQIQVLATPDGAAVIGLPQFIERAAGYPVDRLLAPQFWAERFNLPLSQLTFYGPSSLSYVTEQAFKPQPHAFVRLLRRRDAGELARFARILQAREPHIFHSWAIGGRVTANERLWGAYLEGKLISVGGLRPVHKQLFEVGINTLPRFRQQGWGSAVASAATEAGLALAPLVQWSAPLHNEPSMKIATKLGYLSYAHQLWLSLPETAR